MAGKRSNEVGRKYGCLTVTGEVEGAYPRKVHARCDCGKEVTVYLHNLKSGRTKSCGHLVYSKGGGTVNDRGLYMKWRRISNRYPDNAFKGFMGFKEFCRENGVGSSTRIYPKDTSKPFGPDNFVLSKNGYYTRNGGRSEGGLSRMGVWRRENTGWPDDLAKKAPAGMTLEEAKEVFGK